MAFDEGEWQWHGRGRPNRTWARMSDVRTFVADHLRGKPAPFLFVGSGLTRRYTKAEDWEGLLRVFAEKTDRPYGYYRTSAEGDLPTVASKIAEPFHDLWWSEDEYQESRERWSGEVRGTESALKVEVARHVSEGASRLPKSGALAEELDLLRAAVVDGVITTNFDPVLEAVFPELRVFVGQDEMLFSNPQGVGEIYKIHGSHSSPDSLVLTAADYERFNDRNAYLAAKLLTIFVEHPVIFLGYSVQDRNVRAVLQAIARCLTQENIDELRDRLIFVQWEKDAAAEIGPHTLQMDDFVVTVTRIKVPDFVELFESLGELPRVFPAELLRQLKEHVYDLVLRDDPFQRLVVADIEGHGLDDVDVVFGVGMRGRLGQVGYVGLERWDLIEDIVHNQDAYDGSTIVNQVLPEMLRQPGNVPVFKYLRQADMLTKKGKIKKSADVDSKIRKMADTHRGGDPASKDIRAHASERLKGVSGIVDLEERQGTKEVFKFGTCMPPSKVDPAELRDFLLRNPHMDLATFDVTQYAKLACYLDWLENRHQT